MFYRITGIHEQDSYYPKRDLFIGKIAYPSKSLGQYNGGILTHHWCVYGMPKRTASWYTHPYFYRAYADPLPYKGLTLRVVDVHPQDCYYVRRDEIIGQTCVAEGDVKDRRNMEDGWVRGTVAFERLHFPFEGHSPYFYAIRVEPWGGVPGLVDDPVLPIKKEKQRDKRLPDAIEMLFDTYGPMPDEYLIDMLKEEFPSIKASDAEVKAERCLLGAVRTGKWAPTDKGGRAVVWAIKAA